MYLAAGVREATYDCKVDVWSMGCLFGEIMCVAVAAGLRDCLWDGCVLMFVGWLCVEVCGMVLCCCLLVAFVVMLCACLHAFTRVRAHASN